MRLRNFVTALFLLALPGSVLAVTVDPCATNDLTCNSDLPTYLADTLLPAFVIAFGGIVFAAAVFYGLKLAAESRKDGSIAEAGVAYSQIFAGAAIFLGAFALANAFGTVGTIAPEEVEVGILVGVVAYLIQMVGGVLVLNIVIQSFRMILAQDEGGVSSARTNLISSLIGTAIVMLAAGIFNLVRPGAFNHDINSRIVGIANFVGVFFGLLAVVAIIVAGIMLIVSIDESLKDRAKTIIITALVSVIAIAVSLGVIQILVPT
jgi:hypothetical protein